MQARAAAPCGRTFPFIFFASIEKSKIVEIYKKFINFFENLIKKSNNKNNDPNIIFNGMEINPSGLRPAKNQSVQNVDNRGIFGDKRLFERT